MEIITPMQMYWFTRLDSFDGLFFAMTIVGGIVTFSGIIPYIGMSAEGDSAAKYVKSVLKISVVSLILGVLGLMFVPTQKEAAAIYGIPAIINNQKVQSIGTNTLNVAEMGIQYLKDSIQEKMKKE